MEEFIVTDNMVEKITLTWDGTGFLLMWKDYYGDTVSKLLNPQQAHRISEIFREVETKEHHEGGGKSWK